MAPEATASTGTITPSYFMPFSSGMRASKSTPLPHIATHVPAGMQAREPRHTLWQVAQECPEPQYCKLIVSARVRPS